MTIQRLLSVFLVVLIICQVSLAQTLTPPLSATRPRSVTPVPSAEETRVARLAGLAKVWGAVKYFHPYLAYRQIDWDKALIETLPKVSAAKTPQEYESAVNAMLAVLEDKSTRAEIEAERAASVRQERNTDEKPIKSENGIVVIKAAQIGAAVVKENDALGDMIGEVTQALPNAKGVVIDMRSAGFRRDFEWSTGEWPRSHYSRRTAVARVGWRNIFDPIAGQDKSPHPHD